MYYEKIRVMLEKAEKGKESGNGKIDSIRADILNRCCSGDYYAGQYRDKVEVNNNIITYKLWDYPIMKKKKDYFIFKVYPSKITVDRLNNIAGYYNIPIIFKIIDGEVYFKLKKQNDNNYMLVNNLTVNKKRKRIDYEQSLKIGEDWKIVFNNMNY